MPPTSAAAWNATLLCLVSFLFSSRCYSYDDVNEVQPGLVGGEPVVGLSVFFVVAIFLVCCIARCSPPRWARRQGCYSRSFYFVVFTAFLRLFVFCPSEFSIKFFFV